jgi:DNA-binding beta-propeller fold protein YncE
VDFIALDNPSYLEIDLLGNLYVSEQELDTVLVFEVFDDTLLGPAEIGHPALNDPQGIAVSLLNKSIFVGSDDHIFVFDLGGSFVTSYTHPLLQEVRGLEVDRNGYLYASSFAGDAVLVLEPMFGELVTALTDPQLDGPTGIAIDQLGNIWVGSFNNNRVIRFQPDGDFDGALQVADLLLAPTGVALTPQSVVVEGVEPGLLVGNFHETLLISSSGAGQVLQLDPESGVLLDSVAVGVPSGVAAMENPPPLNRSFLPVVAKGG